MKMTDRIKLIEQMFRDKRPAAEIRTAIAGLGEAAEAEEEAQRKPLTPEHRRVLEILNLAGDYCEQEIVAQKLGTDVPRTAWLLESLLEGAYVMWGNPHRYRIEQKGRDFLYNPPT